MDLTAIGKWLLLVGAVVAGLGGLLWLAGKTGVPIGQLPGDIRLGGERWSFYFPLATCLIVSALLTVLVNVFLRMFR